MSKKRKEKPVHERPIVEELTLEQIQEKQATHLLKNKDRADNHVTGLSERLLELQNSSGDLSEIARIEKLIKLHTDHRKNLDAIDPLVIAERAFSKISERRKMVAKPVKRVNVKSK
jgi:hypothetical protein